MKKLIPLLILLGGAVSGFSQGTVAFQNFVGFQTTDPTGGAHLVYNPGTVVFDPTSAGTGLRGTQYVAELYAGTDAGSLVPLTTSVSRFRSTTSTAKGKWGTATLANLPNDAIVLPQNNFGSTAFLQVKVWDLNTGASFETASGLTGASSVFTYKVPVAGDTFIPNYFMENLQAFALVPEPSAIALGASENKIPI